MSAEGLFKGLGAGLAPVVQYTAEESMEKARLLEEDNLARFHEMGEDARQSKQLDMEKQLRALDQSAQDRRQQMELKQNQGQFEQTFQQKVKEDVFSRADQIQMQYRTQASQYLQGVTTNPLMAGRYNDMLSLQTQIQQASDPKAKAALTQQLQANPIYANLAYMDRLRINSIMPLASNPAEYATLAVTYGGASPETAAAVASQKFGVANKFAPGAPASAAAPVAASNGDIVTSDHLDQIRAQSQGPGTVPAASVVPGAQPMALPPSVPDATAAPVQDPSNPNDTSSAGRFAVPAQPPVMPGGGIPGMISRVQSPTITPPPSVLGPRFGGAPGIHDIIPPPQPPTPPQPGQQM